MARFVAYSQPLAQPRAALGPSLRGRTNLEALPSPRPQSPGFAKGKKLLVSPMVLFFSLPRTPYSSKGCWRVSATTRGAKNFNSLQDRLSDKWGTGTTLRTTIEDFRCPHKNRPALPPCPAHNRRTAIPRRRRQALDQVPACLAIV